MTRSLFLDHFRIELQRIRDLDGIITVCAQEKLKIIKVIDRVSRFQLDPLISRRFGNIISVPSASVHRT